MRCRYVSAAARAAAVAAGAARAGARDRHGRQQASRTENGHKLAVLPPGAQRDGPLRLRRREHHPGGLLSVHQPHGQPRDDQQRQQRAGRRPVRPGRGAEAAAAAAAAAAAPPAARPSPSRRHRSP
ncbi:hypothetical protein FOCC_FOCC008015, partial [Frankliniella occidentalis]